jgi:ribosomal protein L12E/L44/L45/RPP1/RPP2
LNPLFAATVEHQKQNRGEREERREEEREERRREEEREVRRREDLFALPPEECQGAEQCVSQ